VVIDVRAFLFLMRGPGENYSDVILRIAGRDGRAHPARQ
jgi:hypothetical protein